MMAASNAAVAGLNERAQAELRAAGVVTGDATAVAGRADRRGR